jgi:hypothetical protein
MFKKYRINRIKCKIAGLESLVALIQQKDDFPYYSSDMQYFSDLSFLKEKLRQLQE